MKLFLSLIINSRLVLRRTLFFHFLASDAQGGGGGEEGRRKIVVTLFGFSGSNNNLYRVWLCSSIYLFVLLFAYYSRFSILGSEECKLNNRRVRDN